MKFNIILIVSLLYLSILQFFGNGPSSGLATIIAPDNQLNNGIKIKKSFEGENAAIKIEKPKKPFSAQFGLRRKRQYAAVIDQPLPSKPKKEFFI
ncbi:hypothetical protein ACQ4LE_005835 [Meloidogyne hapla]|uniref:Uncharacterized protein n=1 Tax=Meloidogyne hapla TaxID=6305 RepID=A0A1I8C270_MELHA